MKDDQRVRCVCEHDDDLHKEASGCARCRCEAFVVKEYEPPTPDSYICYCGPKMSHVDERCRFCTSQYVPPARKQPNHLRLKGLVKPRVGSRVSK